MLCECAATVCLNYRVPPDTVQLDLPPCIVRGRRIDLDIIFRNLIDNAVKYAGTPPQVEVCAAAAGRTARSSCGSPTTAAASRRTAAQDLRPLRAAGLELEREKPGTGLGLYIVRTLVRRLRGSIRVRDRPARPGQRVRGQSCRERPPDFGVRRCIAALFRPLWRADGWCREKMGKGKKGKAAAAEA